MHQVAHTCITNIYIPKNQLVGVGFLKKSKNISYLTANSGIKLLAP